MEHLNKALKAVKLLRSSVGDVFETLSKGLRTENGRDAEDVFLLDLQEILSAVNANLTQLESSVNALNVPVRPLSVGNTSYLNHEITEDNQALYADLANSHKWISKVRKYSGHAQSLMRQNIYPHLILAKRRRNPSHFFNISPQNVDRLIAGICKRFKDMAITVSRPIGASAVLHVQLGNTLHGVIVMKGLLIEWVVVKGHGESLSLWTESRHSVFRKVTENANAGMLHFHSPTLPDLGVKSFMSWFHSFITLFSAPCKKCGRRLNEDLPPTWRDFHTLEPFHELCKM